MSLHLYAGIDPIYCGGENVGDLTTWITPDGFLLATNSSNRNLRVTIVLGGTRNTVVVIPAKAGMTPGSQGYNCGKVATGNDVQFYAKTIVCN